MVDFSDPIITYGEGLFVAAKDTKDYTSMADLKGEIVGVQIGTAYVKPLNESGLFKEDEGLRHHPRHHSRREPGPHQGRLRRFSDRRLPDLQQGAYPRDPAWPRATRPVLPGSVGIGVKKGDKAMLDKINAALRKFKADGTTDKILATSGA